MFVFAATEVTTRLPTRLWFGWLRHGTRRVKQVHSFNIAYSSQNPHPLMTHSLPPSCTVVVSAIKGGERILLNFPLIRFILHWPPSHSHLHFQSFYTCLMYPCAGIVGCNRFLNIDQSLRNINRCS